MKKKLLALALLIIALVAFPGCTPEEPGYVVTTSDSEVMIVDEDGDIILINEDYSVLVTLSLDHHLIYEGDMFMANIVDEAMADGENITLAFRTMVEPIRVHMFFESTTLVGGDLAVWEDATWTTGTGVTVPIINRNRETPVPDSGLLEDLTATPIFTATNNVLDGVGGFDTLGATRIHRLYAWGSKEFAGGSIREVAGFLLKPDTQYVIIFTAEGAANKAQIILNWYEHLPN